MGCTGVAIDDVLE